MRRGNACSWCTVIKQRTDVGFVETDEGRSRRAIGQGEDRIQFQEAMTGNIGKSMIVRFEGKSRVKGNTKKFNRCRSRDNLTIIRYVLWFELFALSPFKEQPNRFGAA